MLHAISERVAYHFLFMPFLKVHDVTIVEQKKVLKGKNASRYGREWHEEDMLRCYAVLPLQTFTEQARCTVDMSHSRIHSRRDK